MIIKPRPTHLFYSMNAPFVVINPSIHIRTIQYGQDEDHGDTVSSFIPTAGGGMVIKFCEEQEVRIENRKIKVPVRLTGEESDREMAA